MLYFVNPDRPFWGDFRRDGEGGLKMSGSDGSLGTPLHSRHLSGGGRVSNHRLKISQRIRPTIMAIVPLAVTLICTANESAIADSSIQKKASDAPDALCLIGKFCSERTHMRLERERYVSRFWKRPQGAYPVSHITWLEWYAAATVATQAASSSARLAAQYPYGHSQRQHQNAWSQPMNNGTLRVYAK
jgi:hypothetical protein